MKFPSQILIGAIVSLSLICGCKQIGFRDLDETRHGASVQAAKQLLQQLQSGLETYKSQHRTYPVTTEEHLYDSLRTLAQIDPTFLYRNEGGRGYYLAVGGRVNRIVYRYPATVGPEEYALYWVGVNGVDEEGEGDDIPVWHEEDTVKRLERKRSMDLRNDGSQLQILLLRTGPDVFRDSVRLSIREKRGQKDTVLFHDGWPLLNYFRNRPELTEADRRRIVREELEKLLATSQFVRTDSLPQHDWGSWDELKPKSLEMSDIVKKNELMFNYYTGATGSRGIVWSPSRKKFIRAWRTG